jgi:F-type H+-transporting ATPase subunit epsilon
VADGIPSKLHLVVVTRERKIVEIDVEEVILPGYKGELGVLPGHTPLLAVLRVGIMRYREGGKTMSLVLSWGFAEVLPDRVIVMAETAKLPAEIDAAEAQAALREAEKEIADLSSHDPQFAQVEARLEESVAMINLHREM